MVQTVKEFVQDSYQLISANSPTVPLQGNDMSKGIQFLNQLVQSYSSSALLITVAKTVTFDVAINQSIITFGSPDYTPTPDVTSGRLANLENAWLTLQGVTYPLIDESRNVFFGSYKYDPQEGLPRFCIITNDTNLTTMRIYPGPSQVYTLNVFGKFEMPVLTANADMSGFPNYFIRFLQLALARDLAFYKGRATAWTPDLKELYQEAKDDMEGVSAINLVVESATESYLNGAWRVRAGI